MTGEIVFLSHTSELSTWPTRRSFIRAAKDAVEIAEMVPREMSTFHASHNYPRDECIRYLTGSTVYVGIVGLCFGSLVPASSVSYTELEFDTAGELGIPRLMFLVNDPRDRSSVQRDGATPADALRTEIDRFRAKVSADRVVRFVEDPEDLVLRLSHSLKDLASRRVAPEPLAPGWVMAGQGALAETRSHFDRRGRGQRSRVGAGDLFRGRGRARAAVTDWLTATTPPGRVMVVTGQPGAGKSALVARAVLDLEAAAPGDRGLAFHAREATVTDLFAGLGRLAGLPAADSITAMIAALRETPSLRLVVDALDEAASDADRDRLVEAITELGKLPGARVVVATRPMTAGNRCTPGTLFHRLGVRSPAAPHLVDLDENQYFERAGVRDFAAALLRQEGVAVPTPAGGAWQTYRHEEQLTLRLADEIAAKAGRNYLVAALTADPLSQADEPVDPDRADFDHTLLAANVGEALAKYLDRQPVATRVQVRGLLTALAYARGGGIEDGLWLRFAQALGIPAEAADLHTMRGTATADYLLQTSPRGGVPLTRLFHQALIDELLESRDRQSDEDALLSILLPVSPATWLQAGAYERTFAADHAAAADRLTELLTDAIYPTVADLDRLLPLLPPEPAQAVAGVVAILRTAANQARTLDHARRSRLLALTAAHLGHPELTTRFGHAHAAAPGRRATPGWAHSIGTPHQELSAGELPVLGLAFGLASERVVLVSSEAEGPVSIRDPDTGRPLGTLETAGAAVRAVACGRVGEQDIVVGGCGDGTVVFWDAVTGQRLDNDSAGHDSAGHDSASHDPAGHDRAVLAVAFGRDLAFSAGADGTIRRWEPLHSTLVGEPLRGDDREVRAVAVGRHGLRDIVVAGGYGGMVRAWDQRTGEPVGSVAAHGSAVGAVATTRIGDRDVAVSGGADGVIRLWDIDTGDPVGGALIGHRGAVRAIAVGRAGGAAVLVSAGDDAEVRVWDPATGRQLGAPLRGHAGGVRALAYGMVARRPVIASTGDDGTIRLWDPYAGMILRFAQHGHDGRVLAIAAGNVVHNATHTWDVVVSAGDDRTVRIWDAGSGQPIGESVTGHSRDVTTVAVDSIPNREVVLTGGEDRTIRLWDPRTGTERARVSDTPVRAVALVRDGGKRIVVSGDADGALRLWEPGRSKPLLKTLTGHSHPVTSVAVGRVGRTDMAVSASVDGTVRRWDLRKQRSIGEALRGHNGPVRSVALGRVGGRDAIASGGADGTVRLWDASAGTAVSELGGHEGPVIAIAVSTIDGRDVVVSGGEDHTLRLWDPADGSVMIQDCYFSVHGIAIVGALVIFASGPALCTVSLS